MWICRSSLKICFVVIVWVVLGMWICKMAINAFALHIYNSERNSFGPFETELSTMFSCSYALFRWGCWVTIGISTVTSLSMFSDAGNSATRRQSASCATKDIYILVILCTPIPMMPTDSTQVAWPPRPVPDMHTSYQHYATLLTYTAFPKGTHIFHSRYVTTFPYLLFDLWKFIMISCETQKYYKNSCQFLQPGSRKFTLAYNTRQ